MHTTGRFLKAIARGDAATVTEYLSRKDAPKWLAATGENGDTPLHIAARHGHADVIGVLLKSGCNIESRNQQGYTPLFSAATNYGTTAAMRALIEAGADVKAESSSYGPMLALVARRGNKDTMRLLLDAKADPNAGNPLLRALESRDTAGCCVLLEAGANPDTPGDGSNKWAPLHCAVYYNMDDALKAMLDKTAKVDVQDYEGNTPLHLAIGHGHHKQVQMLLEKGARIDIENDNGMTAHQLALDRGNNLIIRMIDPMAKDAAAKNATALTASADVLPPQDDEVWTRMGAHQLARVGVYPALGRRITEIFNFEARERMIITENLKTGAENVTQPASFDTVDEGLLQKALSALRGLGGEVSEDAVFCGRAVKKTLKP